jgi:phosphocarrier protein HPr
MKRSSVVVPWREGLHFRPAARLMQVAQRFRATILLKRGGQIADLRSVLSIIALCATLGTTLEIETTGDDEQMATQAVEQVFSAPTNADAPTDAPRQGL